MQAEEARLMSKHKLEVKKETINRSNNENYNWLMEHIKSTASMGKRNIALDMSKVFYSTLHRLICEGYDISDNDSTISGTCIISW